MNIYCLQWLIIIGLVTGYLISSYKLEHTPRTIVNKSLWSYFLGR